MRVSSWDVWKGLAIFSVVTIHTSGYLANYSPDSFEATFGVLIRQILNFAVPMFLFISGYFSVSNENIHPKDFYKKKISRILPPYLISTGLYFILKVSFTNELVSPKDIVAGLILGTGIGVGYFVIVLLQFVIITPILGKIKSNKMHIITMSSLFLLGLTYTYINAILFNSKLATFPYSAIPFFVWYPFYHMGFYLAKKSTDIYFSAKTCLILAFFMLIASLLEGKILLYFVGYAFAVSQIKITSLLFSLFICLSAVKIKEKHNNKLLQKLGINSYGIYLYHMIFIWFLTYVLSSTITSHPILCIPLIAFTTIILTYSFIISAKAILGKYATYVIG